MGVLLMDLGGGKIFYHGKMLNSVYDKAVWDASGKAKQSHLVGIWKCRSWFLKRTTGIRGVGIIFMDVIEMMGTVHLAGERHIQWWWLLVII
jgi:hypothetical protein